MQGPDSERRQVGRDQGRIGTSGDRLVSVLAIAIALCGAGVSLSSAIEPASGPSSVKCEVFKLGVGIFEANGALRKSSLTSQPACVVPETQCRPSSASYNGPVNRCTISAIRVGLSAAIQKQALTQPAPSVAITAKAIAPAAVTSPSWLRTRSRHQSLRRLRSQRRRSPAAR